MTTAAPSASLLVPGMGMPADLNLDDVPRDQLKEMCRQMYGDLRFLADYVPAKVGSLLSTGLTFGAAMVAGGIDGYLKEKSNIGPVGINTALTCAAAAGAVLYPQSDVREALAAVARGIGSPLIYNWSRQKTDEWTASRKGKSGSVAA